MVDPLSDVLSQLRMKGTLYFRTAFSAPWGIAVDAQPQVARFHLAIRGETCVQVGDELVRMERGDLVLVPHGAAHVLSDSPGRATSSVGEVLDETAYDGSTDLTYGGGGSTSVLVCGHFGFDDPLLHPVLRALPPIVHLQGSDEHDYAWLDAAMRSVQRETSGRAPGWQTVVDHITSILFIQAVRTALSDSDRSVMNAFVDPQLSRVLAAIHQDPQRSWTLEELGRHAGMSRTVFAHRFKERMGMTCMNYLSQWRMQLARIDLVESGDIVAAVAERCGYQSEASFSRAFSRWYGVPPATYRRQLEGS